MRKFFRDFRDFIQRGNVLDLAVGIIIGGAFGKIVSSLVNDIIMPVVGLVGGKNIQDAKVTLVPAVVQGETIVEKAVTLNYGSFIQFIIDFLIVAFVVFVIVKVVRRMQEKSELAKEKLKTKIRKEEQTEEETVVEEPVVEEVPKPTTDDLLTEIRDLLKAQADK